VAITLWFFLKVLDVEATWVPSVTLRQQGGQESEIDFAMWCQARYRDAFDPLLLIGECKSFNEEFGPRDVGRARDLAKLFPGACFVFATLRTKLHPGEKARLAAFARAGRRHLKAEKWRAPVMVLTGHELMARMGPPLCWKDAGGEMAQFAENYHYDGDLVRLCDPGGAPSTGERGSWLACRRARAKVLPRPRRPRNPIRR
jgi:hypothetical protein